MPDRLVEVTDATPSTTTVSVLSQERPATTVVTTLSADPGTGGTTFTVASTARFPAAGTFKLFVENEIVLATVASPTTFSVTRAQDNTTAAAHAIGTVVSMTGAAQYVIPISNRVVTYCGSVASFRTLGNAASPQVLFTIANVVGSPVLCGVNRLSAEMDATAALTTVAPSFKVYRTTATPSAGTVLTKSSVDTQLTSSASVVLRGATASDGGAATAITASVPAQNPMWSQFQYRLGSATGGQINPDDFNLLPADVASTDWIILRPAEALAVQVEGTAASNAATNHYVIKCSWFEYTIP